MSLLKFQRPPLETQAKGTVDVDRELSLNPLNLPERRYHNSLLALVQERTASGPWDWFRQCLSRVTDRGGYALALLPVLTDRIDTGHWPHHPTEFSTEIVIGLLILFGVHRLYRKIDTFRAIAKQDPLTGLGNRMDFIEHLVTMKRRARQTGMQFALAYIDLNDFKLINDAYGHTIGDQVLEAIAGGLRRSIRSGLDHCFRLGGDEFAVLLSHTEASQGLNILKRGLQDTPVPVIDRLSCAIGIVSGGAPQDATPVEELVERADALMYRAKARVLPYSQSRTERYTQLQIGKASCNATSL
ncbi:MAG: GGDEF domain-containing protein [Myxococcales bacterium]|nr:MAG: GGDEF domain-containing protein [Myxococcales bacterium]